MSALTLRETTLLWSLWSSREDPWDGGRLPGCLAGHCLAGEENYNLKLAGLGFRKRPFSKDTPVLSVSLSLSLPLSLSESLAFSSSLCLFVSLLF